MTDRETLAARIEAATGPDRELDLHIKAAVYGGVVLRSPFNGQWCLYREGTTDPQRGKLVERPFSVPNGVWVNDRYTASVDAAMMLVPEGWFVELEQHSSSWTATLSSALWYDDTRICRDAAAATPALALAAAAIRAGGV